MHISNILARCCSLANPFSNMKMYMRRQTALAKQREKRDAKRKADGEKACGLLRHELKVLEVLRRTDKARATCNRLRYALDANESNILEKLLNPNENRAGRKVIMNSDEDEMIRACMKYTASRDLV